MILASKYTGEKVDGEISGAGPDMKMLRRELHPEDRELEGGIEKVLSELQLEKPQSSMANKLTGMEMEVMRG